jgi:hypothetical protein
VIVKTEFSSQQVQFSAKSRREWIGRVLRVVIRSCIREPVEAIRVLEF